MPRGAGEQRVRENLRARSQMRIDEAGRDDQSSPASRCDLPPPLTLPISAIVRTLIAISARTRGARCRRPRCHSRSRCCMPSGRVLLARSEGLSSCTERARPTASRSVPAVPWVNGASVARDRRRPMRDVNQHRLAEADDVDNFWRDDVPTDYYDSSRSSWARIEGRGLDHSTSPNICIFPSAGAVLARRRRPPAGVLAQRTTVRGAGSGRCGEQTHQARHGGSRGDRTRSDCAGQGGASLDMISCGKAVLGVAADGNAEGDGSNHARFPKRMGSCCASVYWRCAIWTKDPLSFTAVCSTFRRCGRF